MRRIETALILAAVAIAGVVFGPCSSWGATNVVAVRTAMVAKQFEAYAQVEPITTLPIRTVQAGIVAKLEIIPGAAVQAGQKLAELGGPKIQALLTQREAVVSSARATLVSAQKSLAIKRRQVSSRLATQQMALQAESAVAQAQAAFDTAQSQLQALRRIITVTAPADGTALAVNATDGQRVGVGETLLTLQVASKLWLKARYYGADVAAIHVGMAGQFAPASGGDSIPVKVVTVFGALTPDGGESVGLLSTAPTPGWLNGEFGAVTLKGPVRRLVVVPTRALILDQGRWWVLVHTDQGDRRRAVTPGTTRGWQTYIKSGLKAGDQVVVENAYLEFHRSISKTYQPPD